MAIPFLDRLPNPGGWFRETIAPGSDARQFWLGGTRPEERRLERGDVLRGQLENIYGRAMGTDPFREGQLALAQQMQGYTPGITAQIPGLQAAAGGTVRGSGERAAERAGERALAQLRSQAAGARGFGAGAARRQAMLGSADIQREAAGQQAQAARMDQERAVQALLQALGQQSQAELANRAQLAGMYAAGRQGEMQGLDAATRATQAAGAMDVAELQARMQAGAMDRGWMERLLGVGGTVAGMGG